MDEQIEKVNIFTDEQIFARNAQNKTMKFSWLQKEAVGRIAHCFKSSILVMNNQAQLCLKFAGLSPGKSAVTYKGIEPGEMCFYIHLRNYYYIKVVIEINKMSSWFFRIKPLLNIQCNLLETAHPLP